MKAGDLRRGRVSEIGRVYLLTAVVDQRRQLFADWRVGRLLVEQFRLVEEDGWAVFLAWVVMPDHFHCVVELHDTTLAQLMCRIKSRSSLAINRTLGLKGQLWQKGYHDRAVREDEDVKHMARYVVQNPIRAGLVQRVHDYPLWDACWL